MLRVTVAVLLSLPIFGCAGTPPAIAPERPLPALCLAEPRTAIGSTLPEWFDRATLADQLALLLNAHELDVAAAAERDIALQDCRSWHAASK